MKRFFYQLIFLLFLNFYGFSQDFENSFLGGYLNFEKFFSGINGEYGLNFFPLLNRAYGGRDIAFSQAFSSVCDDISSLENNPASTSSLKYTELFVSHSKLYGDINYNSLAFTIRFNELGFGVGSRVMYIPFTRYDMIGEEVASSFITYTILTFNVSYNFLRTFENFGFSVGSNVKLYIYGVPDNIYANQTTANVCFDLGLLTRFNFIKFYKSMDKNWGFSFVVKNLGPFTYDEAPPTTLVMGLSYKPIERLLFSTDFNYLISFSELTYLNWNVKAGMEIKIVDFFSIIGGVDIKSSPSFSFGINVDLKNFKLVATYNPDLVDVGQFSISASIKLGDMGRKKFEDKINKRFSEALEKISKSEFYEAKKIFEEILIKYPKYTPAKKNLITLNKLIDVYEKVEKTLEETERLFE